MKHQSNLLVQLTSKMIAIWQPESSGWRRTVMARLRPREALSLRPKTGQIQCLQRQKTDKFDKVNTHTVKSPIQQEHNGPTC